MANALIFRPLEWAAITASTTQSGFAAENLAPWPVPRMGLVWRRTASGNVGTLDIDLGSDQAFDTIALFGIGNGNAAPSPDWTWQVQIATQSQGPGFAVGEFWDGALVNLVGSGVLPVSGRGKALWLAPAGAPAAARYIRLRFTNLSGAPLQIALVAIGKRFQPERNYSFGAAFGVRDLGETDYSPRGVVIARPGVRQRGFGLTLRTLHQDELEGQLQRLFEQVGTTRPVVLVTDPSAHPQIMNRMGIGFLTGNLGSIHRVPRAFQAELNFVAVD